MKGSWKRSAAQRLKAKRTAEEVAAKKRLAKAAGMIHPKDEVELRGRGQANVVEDLMSLLKMAEERALNGKHATSRFIAREEAACLTRALEAVR